MKKLLITLFVLFIAPAASAVTAELSFTGELPGPGGIELAVVSGYYDTYIAMVIEDPGVLSNFTCNPCGGIPPIIPQTIIIGGDSGEVCGFPATCPSGVWMTADWYSTVPVWVRAYETIDTVNWTLLDEIQIPEPMTIALLGLGGLFLLRRRRRK
jgi:hypothetical protein